MNNLKPAKIECDVLAFLHRIKAEYMSIYNRSISISDIIERLIKDDAVIKSIVNKLH